MPHMLTVTGSIEDDAKHSDAAYSLCGIFTVDEFLKELRSVLENGDWGLTNAVGDEWLHLTLRKGVHPDN